MNIKIGSVSDAAQAIGLKESEVWEAVRKDWLKAICPECGFSASHSEECSEPPFVIYHPE